MARYEHTPRPLIEDHHHIRDLIEGQERRTEDRVYHQNRIKANQERDKDIKDAKGQETKPFWCETCKLDFFGESIKEVEVDWSCPTQNIAFYRTKCFKGHWTMRLITDPHKDSYYAKSLMVAKDRGSHSLDILQPNETNFNLIYGKK